MDQPLDLTISNTKTPFTIEYLTSEHSHQRRPRQSLPLTCLENRPWSVAATVNPLEVVNGGHGIKNPLFDCATEALQIKYGRKEEHILQLTR